VKTGELANILNVEKTTLYNWLKRPELGHFFSQEAKGEAGGRNRIFNESDVLALNTIRHLDPRRKTWKEIAEMLGNGYRDQEFPQNAISQDTRLVPMPQAKQAAEVVQMQERMNAALKQVEDIQTRMQILEEEKKEQSEEIKQLNREVGRLEATVEMLREQMEDKA
jgi:DNA-binding transcriptional MerR regulator